MVKKRGYGEFEASLTKILKPCQKKKITLASGWDF